MKKEAEEQTRRTQIEFQQRSTRASDSALEIKFWIQQNAKNNNTKNYKQKLVQV